MKGHSGEAQLAAGKISARSADLKSRKAEEAIAVKAGDRVLVDHF